MTQTSTLMSTKKCRLSLRPTRLEASRARFHSWCRQRHRPPYDAAFARAGGSVVVTDLSEQANQVTASMIEDRRAGARRSMRRKSPRPSTMRRPTSGLVPRDHRRRGDAAIPAFPRDEMS